MPNPVQGFVGGAALVLMHSRAQAGLLFKLQSMAATCASKSAAKQVNSHCPLILPLMSILASSSLVSLSIRLGQLPQSLATRCSPIFHSLQLASAHILQAARYGLV